MLLMYVIKKLRLNRFKAVPVQSPQRLHQLLGESKPIDSKQTFDNIEVTIPYGAKKTQAISMGEEIAQKALEFAENPNGTDPLSYTQPKEK